MSQKILQINSPLQAKKLSDSRQLVGVFSMPDEVYHHPDCPGISRSQLDDVLVSPAYWKFRRENPQEQTPNMISGSALHCKVLTPSIYDGKYGLAPGRKGSKAYDAFMEANPGFTLLTEAQFNSVDGMAVAISKSPRARGFLSGHQEYAFFWYCPITGRLMKCKPDNYHTAGFIADIKTIDDADCDAFMNHIFNMRYHMQNAFYMTGVKEAITQAGLDLKIPEHFVFIGVERKEPHEIIFADLEPEMVSEGERLWKKAATTLDEALKSNYFARKCEVFNPDTGEFREKVTRLKSKPYMYPRDV